MNEDELITLEENKRLIKDEYNSIKLNINIFESFIKKHRKSMALFFILVIGLASFFLFMKGSESFNTNINYASESGLYNCTETYRFNKLISEKCELPGYTPVVDLEYFNK